MKNKKAKLIIFIVVIFATVVSCIHPPFPEQLFLQHIGTFLLLLIPLFDLRSNKLSLFSFSCICLFILLHIIGARYIYSYVPYNEWFLQIFHTDLNGIIQAPRNEYDRLVHFSFGLLFFPYLYETVGIRHNLKKGFKLLVVWSFIQTISMCYELFEWSLTWIMTGTAADDYNGQQGDVWDAQKDMAMAMLGSTITLLVYLFRKDERKVR